MHKPSAIDHRFTLAEVADAVGIPVATVRAWFNKQMGPFNSISGVEDAPAGGTRYVSAPTALAVAICAALTKLGVPLSRAAYAGNLFAHTGYSGKRLPCQLYKGSVRTMISVPAGDGEIDIFPADKTSGMLLLTKIGEEGAAVLPVDPIMERMEKKLRALRGME